MSKPLPDWATVGAQVAEYSIGFNGISAELVTIARVTTARIVLTSGRKYSNRSYTDAPNLRIVGEDAYSNPTLLPADAPEVVKALAQSRIDSAYTAVAIAAEKLDRYRDNADLAREVAVTATRLAILLEQPKE